MLISWNTTRRCNLFCRHCYRESGPDEDIRDELSTAEGRKLIASIAEAGFRLLIFSGGEPLLREDILELVAAARDHGIVPAMGTNGTLLTETVARELAVAGLRGIAISVDSLDREYHDAFRGSGGAYDLTQEGIRNALAAGLRVQINLTLTEKNLDEFDKMVAYYESTGVHAIHPFFLVPTGRARSMQEELHSGAYFGMIRKILERQATTTLELKPTCAPQFMPMAKEMGIAQRFTRGCSPESPTAAFCRKARSTSAPICRWRRETSGGRPSPTYGARARSSRSCATSRATRGAAAHASMSRSAAGAERVRFPTRETTWRRSSGASGAGHGRRRPEADQPAAGGASSRRVPS